MAVADTELEYLRSKTAEYLRKVPSRVLGGSVQVSRDFKKFYGEAMKTLEKSRLTKDQLLSLHNRTLEWYQ